MGTGSQEETAATILELARSDRADVIQKGNISTPILNRQLVKLRTRDTMSLATVFQADCFRDGASMVMTDAGVSAILNYSRMTGLIDNAVEIAQCALGLPMPKVALLAGNEKVMQALPSTGLAHDLANAHWDDAIVYGPLSFDLAVDPESVRLKKLDLPAGLARPPGRRPGGCPGQSHPGCRQHHVQDADAHGGHRDRRAWPASPWGSRRPTSSPRDPIPSARRSTRSRCPASTRTISTKPAGRKGVAQADRGAAPPIMC